jgi:hypothetical protein
MILIILFIIKMEQCLENLEHTGKKQPIEKKIKFRLSGRNLFLTYPKCDIPRDDAWDLLQELLVRGRGPYHSIHAAQEKHKDGDIHYHVLVCYENKIDVRVPSHYDLHYKGITYHGNYQIARDPQDVLDYIMKSDPSPNVLGVFRTTNKKIKEGMNRRELNVLYLSKSMSELVDDGDISLYSYKQIKENRIAYFLDKTPVPHYQPKTCYWIVGKSGIGKSRWARETYANQCYIKPMTKWWDGYYSQPVVILDDFDHQGSFLGHNIKIWADCYSFNAEVKGSVISPVATTFIITSQYTPRDIWCYGSDESKWDTELVSAIRRRFQMKTIEDGFNLVDYFCEEDYRH